MDSINPNYKRKASKKELSVTDLLDAIKNGSRSALSKGLTLAESKLAKHQEMARELIHLAMPLTGNSIRLGITGVPGAGKSTFIESFGLYLVEQGHKVAVLAIDPSSTKSKGSILGDKTRMDDLSKNEMAFIRPSPSGGSLGGVTQKTRESILLCEAAGYDIILVETVGVGQSETTVKSMVDFFMLLMIAGAGDELQGIKRGIMEMADLLLVNKADGDNANKAKQAALEYKRALHLFPPNLNGWTPKSLAISALEKRGLVETFKIINSFKNQQKLNGHFSQNRTEQAIAWYKDAVGQTLMEELLTHPNRKDLYLKLEQEIREGKAEPGLAAQQLIKMVW